MKIEIKGKPYKVVLKDDTFISGDNAVWGCIDYNKKEISITTKEEKETPKTVLHELIHGYLYECGLTVYAHDETLVEWFARHFEDISKSAIEIVSHIEKNKAKE